MQHYSTPIHRMHTLAQEKPVVELGNDAYQQQRIVHEAQSGVINILLVDDHVLVREGLRHLCSLQEELRVVGEATESAIAIRMVEQLQPDIVLVDIHQSPINAISLTRCITQTVPETAVLLLTTQCNQQYITQAFKNGARGYLLASASFVEVIRAIRIVHDGGTYITQELARTLATGLYQASGGDSFNGRRREPQLIDVLTGKEIEIVRHVATGMSNKEIASKLAYSEKTVKNYLSTIFQKLNIRDRTQAAILALKQGLLVD